MGVGAPPATEERDRGRLPCSFPSGDRRRVATRHARGSRLKSPHVAADASRRSLEAMSSRRPMRTYVCVMGLGPYRPIKDLERALERGELDLAIAAAKDVSREYGGPIKLDIALRFLPVVSEQRREDYDGWALRWLARWSTETPGATIEQAAEVAACLADLPAEPTAFETIRRAI